MRIRAFISAALAVLLCACQPKGPEDVRPQGEEFKVAMVFPRAEWESIGRVADWVLENLEAAQEGDPNPIRLSLEWIDEDGAGMAGAEARET